MKHITGRQRAAASTLAAVVACALLVHAGAVAPPTLVNITSAGASWETGTISVSWTPPSPQPSGYVVTASPLDDVNEFNRSTALLDWVVSPGLANHSVGVDTARSAAWVNYTGFAWQSEVLGRGFSPYVFRRVPDGAAVELTIGDCSAHPAGARAHACGIVLYNAGSSRPLLTWMLTTAPAEGWTTVTLSATSLNTSFSAADNGDAWPLRSVQLRVERNTADALRPWTLLARSNTSIPWSNVTVRVTVASFQLDSFHQGDIWYGFGAAANGTGTTSAVAYFDAWRMTMPVPAAAPLDLYGATDVCIAAGGIRAVSVTAFSNASSATISGLSNNFPYSITVQAIDRTTGILSDASQPIEGTFFWARRSPPRQQRLSLWLNSKWLVSAPYLYKWPDASGNEHHMTQPLAGDAPSVVSTNSFMSAGYVKFQRAYGHYMASGADSIDLGFAGGPMTVYVVGRMLSNFVEVIAGKGYASQTFDSSRGSWLLGVWSTPSDVARGIVYTGMRISSTNGSHAAASTGVSATGGRYVVMPASGIGATSNNVLHAVVGTGDARTAATLQSTSPYMNRILAPTPVGTYRLQVCIEPTCTTNQFAKWDLTNVSNIISAHAAVEYQQGAGTDRYSAVPAVDRNQNFHIGGPNIDGGEPAYALDAEIYDIIIYREAHTTAQKALVAAWVKSTYEDNACSRNLNTVTTNTVAACTTGNTGTTCTQSCRAGLSNYVGWWSTKTCTNGAWNQPALLCRKQCPDVAPPLYAASCFRDNWLNETFDPAINADALTMFTPMPSVIEFQRARLWTWDRTAKLLAGSTRNVNSCNRETSARSIFSLSVIWANVNPYYVSKPITDGSALQVITADVMLADNASIAGIATRIETDTKHYRVELSRDLVTLIRANGADTVIASVSTPLAAGRWYNVQITHKGLRFSVALNNVTIITVMEPSTFAYGGSMGGLFLGPASEGSFDNFRIGMECDMATTTYNYARNIFQDTRIVYKCRDGMTPVGSLTWTCSSSGTYAASLVCRSPPPTPATDTFFINEMSPNGTYVGQVVAIPAFQDQTLTYEIVAESYRLNNTPSFALSSCGGTLRVNQPDIDYWDVAEHAVNVSIFVYPDSQQLAGITFNVTVRLINVPSAPVIPDAAFSVNSSYIGPLADGGAMTYNRNRYPLKFQIIGGNPTPPLFAIDAKRGNVSVIAPGPVWTAFLHSYTLTVKVEADGVTAAIPLESTATWTVEVLHLNGKPVWQPASGPTFYVNEADIAVGVSAGTLSAVDTDMDDPTCDPAWYNVTYTLQDTGSWRGTNNIFTVAGNRLVWDNAPSFDPVLDYSYYGRYKVRGAFSLPVLACDTAVPALCSNATVVVAVLSVNATSALPVIADVIVPVGGMKTDGTSTITLVGSDMPTGGSLVLSYKNELGLVFNARNCVIKSAFWAECTAAPGYGAGFAVMATMDGQQLNGSVTSRIAYAAPSITSVTILQQTFTTAGGVDVLIQGSDIYGPVSITFGASNEFVMTPKNLNASFATARTSLTAALGAGCGSSLPVTITIAGQASTCAGTCTVSFPAPTLTAVSSPAASSYNVTALATLGGQKILVRGTNLGPTLTGAAANSPALQPRLTYTDASGIFSYSTLCSKSADSPHTLMECQTVAGVGTGLLFAANVCGLSSSLVPLSSASYAKPVLREVTGPGSSRASTEGGQIVVLSVREVGPRSLIDAIPFPITDIRYGTPGLLQFIPTGCYVSFASTSGSEITCLTAAGFGANHAWQLSVGFQSTYLAANTSYGPPTIYQFGGFSEDAKTSAGSDFPVDIYGTNFGPDLNAVRVSFGNTLNVPRDSDGVVPSTSGRPAGQTLFTPTSCSFVQLHRQLRCIMPAAAGKNLNWQIVVGGLYSSSPTTSFAKPVIESAAINGTATTLTTDGGVAVAITGQNFNSDASMVQSIRYGPATGAEFEASLVSVDHTRIVAITRPGIGANLAFKVVVADQSSAVFRSAVAYAQPNISALSVTTVATELEGGRFTTMTLTGTEFGTLNADVDLLVLWGNPSDGPVLRIVPLLKTASVASAAAVQVGVPVQYTVQFAVPSGVGKLRAVRVLPYLRGSVVTEDAVSQVALQGRAAFVNYAEPRLSYAVVYRPTQWEVDNVAAALFPVGTDLSPLKRVEITGTNMGPSVLVTGDFVGRWVESSPNPPGYGPIWTRNATAVAAVNWTSTHLSVYVIPIRLPTYVRVTIESTSFDGTQQYQQTSNVLAVDDFSPKIGALTGMPTEGFATVGGGVMTLEVSGMTGTIELNVTVTMESRLVNAQLLAVNGITRINNWEEAVAMLAAQSGGFIRGDFTYIIKAVVPPGDGRGRLVTVWRNGAPSGVETAGLNLINYKTPVLTAVGVARGSGWDMQSFIPTAAVRPPTSGDGWVRFEGSNLGECPTLTILHRADQAADVVDACIASIDADGNTVVVANPDVRVSPTHTTVDFKVGAGEGTGLLEGVGQHGWYITLSAGLGLERVDAEGKVLLRYAVPVVTALTTDVPIDTRGNALLRLQGANFGFLSTPIVRFYSTTQLPTTCSNVTRASHTSMTCIVPPGSGVNLLVEVRVADLVSDSAVSSSATTFNYSQPVIANMTLIAAGTLNAGAVGGLSQGVVPANVAGTVISPAADNSGLGPQLVGSPHGSDILVLRGRSFGAFDGAANCMLFSWPAGLQTGLVLGAQSAATSGVPRFPICNGDEDFLGEGELFTNSSIVFWDHELIIVKTPGGEPSGTRAVMVMAGNQLPALSQRYSNWRYAAPAVVGARPRETMPTDGGGLLDLVGLFGPMPLNSRINATDYSVPLPYPLPLPDGTMFPVGHVRVDLGDANSAIGCLASAFTTDGLAAPGFSRCRMPSLHSVTLAAAASGQQDLLTVVMGPGVGANKSATVVYLAADGTVLARSSPANFSYDPPVIRDVYPSLILDYLNAPVALYIAAQNTGRLRDVALMEPWEQIITVTVGSQVCHDATRVVKNADDQIQCRLDPGTPVGYQNISINVAGQTGYLSADAPNSILVACPVTTFGHFGESCAPCPMGAICYGFTSDESIGVVGADGTTGGGGFSMYSRVNVSSGPVLVGDVQVARRGFHPYPVPDVGYFNLNGTLMSGACPDMIRERHPGRDTCIVGCVPAEACTGANFCSAPYKSIAPYYRCAYCATGYYRAGGDCIKCPDSPATTIVGFAVLIIVLSGVGYLLQRHEIDVRVISIGVDFFQVLAALSQSKVSWPPEIKSLFRVLSAFNLNIEVVTPECLAPNVTFIQKFAAMLSLPALVLGVFVVAGVLRWIVIRYYFRQKRWKAIVRPQDVSIVLLLIFMVYLNETKMLMGVFECLPAKPDDGKRYMQVGTFEECGKPGGVQEILIPWSVAGLIILVAGYPVGLFVALYKLRAVVMEDQLLRASKLPPRPGSMTDIVRRALSRVYYSYKPQFFYWSIFVIIRKFGIALSSLIFSNNAAYNLTFCCLVLYVAFAIHMRSLPYMPESEFDAVLTKVAARAKVDAEWQRLRVLVLERGKQLKKATRDNTLTVRSNSYAGISKYVGDGFLNYNVVEGILLFLAALVCLLGVLLEVVRPSDSYYSNSRQSLTYCLMLAIIVGIIYFATVLLADIAGQYYRKRAAAGDSPSSGSTGREKGNRESIMKRKGMDILRSSRRFELSSLTNPMMQQQAVAARAAKGDELDESQLRASLDACRNQLTTLNRQVSQLQTDNAFYKKELEKLMGELGKDVVAPRPPRRPTAAARKSFAPSETAAGGTGKGITLDAIEPAAGALLAQLMATKAAAAPDSTTPPSSTSPVPPEAASPAPASPAAARPKAAAPVPSRFAALKPVASPAAAPAGDGAAVANPLAAPSGTAASTSPAAASFDTFKPKLSVLKKPVKPAYKKPAKKAASSGSDSDSDDDVEKGKKKKTPSAKRATGVASDSSNSDTE